MTESYEHRFLKEVALIWLRQQGYLWLGTEISLWWSVPKIFQGQTGLDEFNPNQLTLGGVRHTVVDCIGLKRWYRGGDKPSLWGCGIEVKVSRQDFLSGFCFDRLNQTYIIAPKNMIPKRFLPSRVGLLEVDDVTVNQWGELNGVKITKKARPIMIEFEHLNKLIEPMCRHISIALVKNLKAQLPRKRKPVFKTKQLPIIEKKKNRGYDYES
jgi:hypothetical protein